MAGWSLPRALAAQFSAQGSHLERYAGRLSAVEINSSFYRPHRRTTYERWGAAVPDGFRFAVKLARTITHERRLVGAEAALDGFLEQVAGLGDRLGPILIQLPPSLAFDAGTAAAFFAALRARFAGQAVCEPRHGSWFASAAEALLAQARIARVAADPALHSGAGEPGGWPGLVYLRLHGSPRTYYSDYPPARLADVAETLAAAAASGAQAWCIFDNTALGHAVSNALDLQARLGGVAPT